PCVAEVTIVIEAAGENHVAPCLIISHGGIRAARRDGAIDRHALPANAVIFPGFIEEMLRVIALEVAAEEHSDIPVRVVSHAVAGPITWGADIEALNPLVAWLG